MPDVIYENAAKMPVAACPGCGALAELTAPEQRADPDAAVICAPDGPCCKLDHHHGQAANACTADHSAHACPSPETCGVFPGEGCAGGHCGLGVQDCTVCRPLVVTAYVHFSGQAVA
jgi:hypothetical protein